MKKRFCFFLLFVSNICFAYTIPDIDLTPGSFCSAYDPDFKEYRYNEDVAICKRHVSSKEKRQVMLDYGFDPAYQSDYEIDHCIPLSMGGSNDITNLWPQPSSESAIKDRLETQLYAKLSRGTISYSDAIEQMREWCPN